MILKCIKFATLYTLAALVVGACALIAAFPYHPITIAGWIVWFSLALPIYIFLESVAGRVFSARVGYRVDDSRAEISVRQIVFGFAFAVVALLLGMAIVLIAGGAGGSFWEAHFSTSW